MGSAINGLAAYAYLAVGTRTYGSDAFAPVSVLWTFWAISAAIFTFPLQHWIIRVVRSETTDASIRATGRRLVALTAGMCMVLALVAYAMRGRFFGSSSLSWPTLVALVAAGSALMGFVRGVLASRRRFVATGAAIGAENVIRLVAGAAVAAAGGSIFLYGIALALGPAAALAWPSVARLERGGGRPQQIAEFFGGVGGGILLAQFALNAGPAVLAALGGAPAEVTALFATMALFRAPYLVALGFTTQLTGPLTGLVVAGNETTLDRIRRRLTRGTLAAAAALALLAWIAGRAVVDAIFGADVAPEPWIVAAIAGGSVLAVGGLGLVLLLLARAAMLPILRSWAVALAVGTAVVVVGPGAALADVTAAFLATEATAMLAMDRAERRQSMRSRTT